MSEQRFQDERREKIAQARRGLWRAAVVWTPLVLAAAVGGIYFVAVQTVGGGGQGWFLPVILLVLATLFGFQSGQAIRDLRGGTHTVAGLITRHWSRIDMLVTRSHYLRIDRRHIFRIDKLQHQLVKQGDYVEIEYYPASMIAARIERKQAPEADAPPPPEIPTPDPLLIERD